MSRCGHNFFLAFAVYFVFISSFALFTRCRQLKRTTRVEREKQREIRSKLKSERFFFVDIFCFGFCSARLSLFFASFFFDATNSEIRTQSDAAFMIHIRHIHGVSLAPLTLYLFFGELSPRFFFSPSSRHIFRLLRSIFCSNFD